MLRGMLVRLANYWKFMKGESLKQSTGIRYILVGVASAAIEFSIFMVLFNIANTGIALSNFAALSTSTLFNYFANKTYTFRSLSHPIRSAVLYLLLFAFNTWFTSIAISFLVSLGVAAAIAKIVMMCCVPLWNYFIYRNLIFL